MDNQIIVINGSGGVGKDTFVECCRRYYREKPEENILIHNISTITAIKELAQLIGWQGGKTEKDRKFLSDLKLLCSKYNDFSYNKIKDEIDWIERNFYFKDNIIFIHCREPEEIHRLVNDFNAVSLLIRRPNFSITSNYADGNVENFAYDYIVCNDSDLKKLNEKAILFLKRIKEKERD